VKSRLRAAALVLCFALAVGATALHADRARAAEPQKLFALDAKEGTLTPLAGKPAVFRLVLERVRGRAIYFTDRPGRKVGTVAVGRMLQQLFAGDSPDPNAAVNASAAKRGQLLMGVELLGWRYDAQRQKLALRVRHLPQGGRTITQVREDTVLPRSFHDVSLFIDDCCSVVAPATAFNTGTLDLNLSINNGAQVNVAAASPETWLPGSESIGFEGSGPQPGALGPGTNYLAVVPAGAIAPIAFQVDLPSSIPYRSLQLYLFLGPTSLGWTVLDGGQQIASGVVPAGSS
jgi:hypothetical protein